MQATEALDALVAGAQVQVVGVAEDDGGVEAEQVLLAQRFDRGLGTHRHEHGGLDGAVWRVQHAGAGTGFPVFGGEFEAEGVAVAQSSTSARVTKR